MCAFGYFRSTQTLALRLVLSSCALILWLMRHVLDIRMPIDVELAYLYVYGLGVCISGPLAPFRHLRTHTDD